MHHDMYFHSSLPSGFFKLKGSGGCNWNIDIPPLPLCKLVDNGWRFTVGELDNLSVIADCV